MISRLVLAGLLILSSACLAQSEDEEPRPQMEVNEADYVVMASDGTPSIFYDVYSSMTVSASASQTVRRQVKIQLVQVTRAFSEASFPLSIEDLPAVVRNTSLGRFLLTQTSADEAASNLLERNRSEGNVYAPTDLIGALEASGACSSELIDRLKSSFDVAH